VHDGQKTTAPSVPDTVTGNPANVRQAQISVIDPVPYAPSPRDRMRSFVKRHGRKLWWVHSAYALALGVGVVAFAQKGFEHARWLAVSLGAAWLLLLLFFRVHGSGRQQRIEAAGTTAKLKFFAMTYALKNLYQGMLFFLLPFYWKSTTFWAPNAWFICVLAICALLSTLDIVFDRVVFRFRALASVFHGVALFGCLNLVVPALFPDTRTMTSLLVATAFTVIGFFSIHVELAAMRDRRVAALFLVALGACVGLAYYGRTAIPPVPMYVSRGAVGPMVLPDGRLAMVVRELHPSVIDKLTAITDVVVPGGKGDRLVHVWRHDGREVHRAAESTSKVPGPEGAVRLRSAMTGRQLPSHLVGSWAVDVETQDGQLVGRVSFVVND
jgi:hypothetical protein